MVHFRRTMMTVILGSFVSGIAAGAETGGDKAAAGGGTGMDSGGAATIFSSDEPGLKAARELLAKGELAQADRLLAEHPGRSDAELARACDEGREIIRRYRREYGLGAEALLARLQRAIPDVTAGDLERWRQAGEVQYRVFDGRIGYFRREPGCILRFCPEAKKRARGAAAQTSSSGEEKLLIEHIQKVLSEAEREGAELAAPVRHRIRYQVTVPGSHAALKAGSLVRCWLPFPQESRQQTEIKLLSTSPEGAVITPSTAEGRNPGRSPHRSVYLERKVSDPSRPVVFREEFEYTCRAYVPRLRAEDARPLPADFPAAELAERPPHIVFAPELKEAVAKIVGGETNPLTRARKIYLYIAETYPWCPEEEYCLIPSLALKCFRAGRGDCGVQSTLFITMCRIAGVPARWQSGWETKPVGWNMHDWAEFYVAPWGWLPADVSYGLQKSNDPAVREFYFGHQDSYRMIVNSDYGRPLEPAKASLRSEPADFQRGEVEVDGKNLYFNEWEYKIEFDWK